MRSDAHAFLDGRAIRQTLNPIRLNDIGAYAACLPPAFRRCTRLIRGFEGLAEFWIETLPIGNVCTEAAKGEHHCAPGTDRSGGSRIRLAENIAFANAKAFDSAIFIANDRLHEGFRSNFDAQRLETGNSRLDDALPRALFGNHAAKRRMAAFPREIGLPFDAHFLFRPLERIRSVFAEKINVRRVAKPLSNARHVSGQIFRRVLDALRFLHG